MISLLGLIFLYSCTTLTEAEREYNEYEEQERIIAYKLWEDACLRAGGAIYMHNPTRPCRRSECVPHRVDWDHRRSSNRVFCVSKIL